MRIKIDDELTIEAYRTKTNNRIRFELNGTIKLSTLLKVSEYFGTEAITWDSHTTEGFCDTCDYGQETIHNIVVLRSTKNNNF